MSTSSVQVALAASQWTGSRELDTVKRVSLLVESIKTRLWLRKREMGTGSTTSNTTETHLRRWLRGMAGQIKDNIHDIDLRISPTQTGTRLSITSVSLARTKTTGRWRGGFDDRHEYILSFCLISSTSRKGTNDRPESKTETVIKVSQIHYNDDNNSSKCYRLVE